MLSDRVNFIHASPTQRRNTRCCAFRETRAKITRRGKPPDEIPRGKAAAAYARNYLSAPLVAGIIRPLASLIKQLRRRIFF